MLRSTLAAVCVAASFLSLATCRPAAPPAPPPASPTNRVGWHRYTFPRTDDAHVILDLVSSIYDYDGKVLFSQIRVEGDRRVTGYRDTKGWSPGRPIDFALEFSKPFASYGLVKEADETTCSRCGTRSERSTRSSRSSSRSATAT